MVSVERIEQLAHDVGALYEQRNLNRADWADWLYENHVFQVANKARELASRYGADSVLSQAAGMLHDVADAVMDRFDPAHDAQSASIARRMLTECSFTQSEIELIVDDALRYHSCHEDQIPSTMEGKIVATADAVVHLTTDFYRYGHDMLKKGKSSTEARAWILPKIERDFYKKIFFSEVRDEVRADYERLKRQYS